MHRDNLFVFLFVTFSMVGVAFFIPVHEGMSQAPDTVRPSGIRPGLAAADSIQLPKVTIELEQKLKILSEGSEQVKRNARVIDRETLKGHKLIRQALRKQRERMAHTAADTNVDAVSISEIPFTDTAMAPEVVNLDSSHKRRNFFQRLAVRVRFW